MRRYWGRIFPVRANWTAGAIKGTLLGFLGELRMVKKTQ